MIRKYQLDDPEMQSKDLVAENLEAMKALFPSAFTEGKIDFSVLRQLLGDAVEEGDERYGLFWHGKRRARQLALTRTHGTLRPVPGKSRDWDSTSNVIVEGDNLEVLKVLQKSYASKVKLIYVDPPYNTGKDFVYTDNYQDNVANYLAYTGQLDTGRRLSSDTESRGRTHTSWLNMMYPRLVCAQQLLSDDGAIFVSIDEHEVHNLRKLMDEVFGEERFVAQIAVVNNLKGRNDQKHVATCHEYLLVYAGPNFESNGLPLTDKKLAEYKERTDSGEAFQWRDLRKRGGADTREARPRLYFPLYVNPADSTVRSSPSVSHRVEVFPTKSDGAAGCWRWGMAKVNQNIGTLRGVKVSGKDRWNISYQVFLSADGEERVSKPKSTWIGPEFSTDAATKALRRLVPEVVDITPKPVELISQVARLVLNDGDMLMDFFAGTGTAAEAAMSLAEATSERYPFIVVQLPEPVGGQLGNVPGLMRARLGAVREQLVAARTTSADLGFRSYELAESCFKKWVPDTDLTAETLLEHATNILATATDDDLATEVLLKLGFELTHPCDMRTIAGKTVRAYSGVLYLCFDAFTDEDVDAFVDQLGALHQELTGGHPTPSTVIFRDDRLGRDSVKTNLAAGLEHRGLGTIRSL